MAKKLIFSLIIIVSVAICATEATAAPSLENLMGMLDSHHYPEMEYAFHKLPSAYPDSETARQKIGQILVSNTTIAITQTKIVGSQKYITPMDHIIVTRDAARALGNYHAHLTSAEFDAICALLKTHTPDDGMDALKALRGCSNPECVPIILPYLQDSNLHIQRDTIRTLAVHGDKSLIPLIEPYTHSRNFDLQIDAKNCIKSLSSK